MHLNDKQRQAIRDMKGKNPRMKHREIAAIFGVTTSAVGNILNPNYLRRPEPEPEPAPRPAAPYSTFIRPIPLSRLMAGRA